jgi:hypothetical protein
MLNVQVSLQVSESLTRTVLLQNILLIHTHKYEVHNNDERTRVKERLNLPWTENICYLSLHLLAVQKDHNLKCCV